MDTALGKAYWGDKRLMDSIRGIEGRRRHYLLLQGPVGPFFGQLAAGLKKAGHITYRIYFNGGDAFYGRRRDAVTRDFGGPQAEWPAFLQERLAEWPVTDLVLFGDCRPLHIAAIELARARGIRVHVFEEGYLRPNWITMELGGVNHNSSLPRDPAWLRAAGQELSAGQAPISIARHFARRAVEDILYQLSRVLLSWRYPGYRTHRPWPASVEYSAGAKRYLKKPFEKKSTAHTIASLIEGERPYYLVPLQLDSDAQIRFHSRFGSMAPAIEEIIHSFARNAPLDALLVITEHPLDNGVVDLQNATLQAAAAAGVTDRLVFIRGGSPNELLQKCRALVTVNSTTAIVALGFGIPVAALGEAIYNLPGLTFQGELSRFWLDAVAPDPALFEVFRRVVAARTQINGSFYNALGRRLAVQNALHRLAAQALEQPEKNHESSVASFVRTGPPYPLRASTASTQASQCS